MIEIPVNIIQMFKGEINGIEINDLNVFKTLETSLVKISDNDLIIFKTDYEKNFFIKYLIDGVTEIYRDIYELSKYEIEKNVFSIIDESESIVDLINNLEKYNSCFIED